MAYTVKVFLKSGDFSREFADTHHNGEETAENVRFEWEDEFRINGTISKVEVLRDQVFSLAGEHGDGTAFSHDIQSVTVFEFHSEEGATPVVVSERALDEYTLDNAKRVLEVYLNDDEVVENPVAGLYIALSDFPSELRG